MLSYPARFLLVASLVLPIAVLASAHADHDEGAHATHDISTSFSVKPFGMAELNMEFKANATATWSVQSSIPAYVDLHTHGARGTVNFYNESAVMDTGQQSFVAPSDGTFSIYIINSNETAAQVTLRVVGVFAVASTSGFELEAEEEGLPSVGLLGSLAALSVAFVWRRSR